MRTPRTGRCYTCRSYFTAFYRVIHWWSVMNIFDNHNDNDITVAFLVYSKCCIPDHNLFEYNLNLIWWPIFKHYNFVLLDYEPQSMNLSVTCVLSLVCDVATFVAADWHMMESAWKSARKSINNSAFVCISSLIILFNERTSAFQMNWDTDSLICCDRRKL